jgi:hypothetical protein
MKELKVMGIRHEIDNVKIKCSLSEGTLNTIEGNTPLGEMPVTFPSNPDLVCYVGQPVYFVADGRGLPFTVGNYNQKTALGAGKSSDGVVGIISQVPTYTNGKSAREAEVLFFGYFVDGISENIVYNPDSIQSVEFSTTVPSNIVPVAKKEGLPVFKSSTNSNLILVKEKGVIAGVGDIVLTFFPTTVTPIKNSGGGGNPDNASINLNNSDLLQLKIDPSQEILTFTSDGVKLNQTALTTLIREGVESYLTYTEQNENKKEEGEE